MKIIIFFFFLILLVNSDCPINPYPLQTVAGSLSVSLNNDPQIINTPQQFTYALGDEMEDGNINVATALLSFELNPRQQLDFLIQYDPTNNKKILRFIITAKSVGLGWKSLKFNFFASQSNLFIIGTQTTNQFSVGLSQDKYSIFTPIKIPDNSQTQLQLVTKVFISGIKLKSKPLTNQYYNLVVKYQSFRRFSSNTRLIKYFSQALQEKKSMLFKITSSRIVGRLLAVNFQSNCEIALLSLSYVVFSPSIIQQRHTYISGDLYLINQQQHKFNPLKNMGMSFVGISQFKSLRDGLYFNQLIYENFLEQAKFRTNTNVNYFGTGYTYIAFEMKIQFVCSNCKNSPLVFQNRFCVETCPRGYSKSQRLSTLFCDLCEVDKLKVVDSSTMTCACAKRHYLDSNQDICKPCRYECMTCEHFNKCLTCDNNLFQTKRRMTEPGKCQCPITGFYDDKISQNIVCQKCSPNCLTCKGPRDFDCLTCPQFKQIDFRGFCVCKNGYIQDSLGNCLCLPPRILYNNICIDYVTMCGPDQIQQYVDYTKRCVCKNGYQQVRDSCIKCGQNSIFDSQQLSCKCINNTVMVNGQCVGCRPEYNTVYDPSSGLCVCKQGTFKSDSGYCVQCPVKMIYVSGRCECIYNYFEIYPNVCQRCIRESDGPKCRKNSQ